MVRELELPIPYTREILTRHGWTRRRLEKEAVRAARGIYFRKEDVAGANIAGLPIICRARVAHLRFPSAIIRGWAAASYLGIPYFTETADVMLETLTGHNHASLAGVKARRVAQYSDSWNPDSYFRDLKSATAPLALGDCLVSVRKGYSWWTPQFPKLTSQEVRSIQVIDAFRSFTGIDVGKIREGLKGRIEARDVDKLLSYTDAGAESPPETVLRLTSMGLAPDWESQVEMRDRNGKFLTKADLASEEYKTALFYDGDSHKTTEQMRYDKHVDFELEMQGWKVIRVCAVQMRDTVKLRHDLQAKIERHRG